VNVVVVVVVVVLEVVGDLGLLDELNDQIRPATTMPTTTKIAPKIRGVRSISILLRR
jgi:hypothetical protein